MARDKSLCVGEVVDILVPTDPIVITEYGTADVVYDNSKQHIYDMTKRVRLRGIKNITNDGRTLIIVVYPE